MDKRMEYWKIKNFIEVETNCKLITSEDEYVNNNYSSKLEITCEHCGDSIFIKSFSYFKNNINKLKYCDSCKIMFKKIQHDTIYDILFYLTSKNYKYINHNCDGYIMDISIICDDNHNFIYKYNINTDNIQSIKCPYCNALEVDNYKYEVCYSMNNNTIADNKNYEVQSIQKIIDDLLIKPIKSKTWYIETRKEYNKLFKDIVKQNNEIEAENSKIKKQVEKQLKKDSKKNELKLEKIRIRTLKFKQKVYNLVGDEYEVLGEYINAHTKILIRHITCDTRWYILPDSFLRGRRCPTCKSMSNNEEKIEELLKAYNINYKRQYKFENCINKQSLPFDFAIFDKNNNLLFLLEYDGKQHFESVDWFGGIKQFEYIKINDGIKNNYCKENNILLVRIPYFQDKFITKIIKKWLNKYSLI
jgi:hypothetical protein